MKVNQMMPAIVLLLLAITFSTARVGNYQMQRTATAQPQTPRNELEMQAHYERVKKQQAGWRYARANNYRAKVNNGSRRAGLPLEKLPKALREEAAKLADEYTTGIYPALKKYVAAHDGVLPEAARAYPEFAPFMRERLRSWHIGATWRLDGSYIYRDLYSQDPPDAPHDVWAKHGKFANVPGTGKGFMIYGWDDGRVTFDLVEQMYHGHVHRAIGTTVGMAPPGAAGIPPQAVYGLKEWLDVQEKENAQPAAVGQEAGQQENEAITTAERDSKVIGIRHQSYNACKLSDLLTRKF